MDPVCNTRWTIKINHVARIDQELSLDCRGILSVRMSLWHLLSLNVAQPDQHEKECES